MEAGLEIDGAFRPRRASEWLIALREQPGDAALQHDFEAWLAADAAHRTDWQQIVRTHALLGTVTPQHATHWVPEPRALRPDRADRILPLRARTSGRRWVAMGVAAGIAAAVVMTVFPTAPWWFAADHVTATREIATIHLDDGSTVRLGPESVLDVAFSAGARDVRLLRGSAFFEVTPDAQRPFRVAAGPVQTTVLGTAFEVALEEDAARVAVRHGTVRVDAVTEPAPASQKLTDGAWLRVARDGAIVTGEEPPAQVAAWLEGRLIVKHRPAGEVIDTLRRYYRGVVILRGDDLAVQPLTGVYDVDDPVAAMKAIAGALGAKAYQLSPWVFVLSED
jgi:transmembrane sensor